MMARGIAHRHLEFANCSCPSDRHGLESGPVIRRQQDFSRAQGDVASATTPGGGPASLDSVVGVNTMPMPWVPCNNQAAAARSAATGQRWMWGGVRRGRQSKPW